MTIFLKFPDEATAQEVMADYYQPQTEEQEAYWKTSGYWWGLDVLGIITRTVGEDETETLEGWHLNFNGEIPEAALQYIVNPQHPVRVFA